MHFYKQTKFSIKYQLTPITVRDIHFLVIENNVSSHGGQTAPQMLFMGLVA